MTTNANPLLTHLEQGLRAGAQTRHFAPGDVLFYEGAPADSLFLLTAGRCALSFGREPRGVAGPGDLLDPVATLGGLPHRVKATATEAGAALCWPVDALWQSEAFAAAARRYLADALLSSQTRLDALAAPIHYRPGAPAEVTPGPFLFEDVTLIFAFCEADLDVVRACLPDGLSLLRRPVFKGGPVILAVADFPNAHPEADPAARFGYTETTYFVPARFGRHFGLFVPHIYPSTWEPILLGREIYGFPKRLGRTVFGANRASLEVDGSDFFSLTWEGAEAVSERDLVGALMDWVGIERRMASAAFEAGEVLRRAMRLPPTAAWTCTTTSASRRPAQRTTRPRMRSIA
ncbi:MAG: acetoacetate decarboxylase family protein [Anaerolineae bacterium]|nr:acetoacetate decarboxylase family protein [Anaerolineae bacterium]